MTKTNRALKTNDVQSIHENYNHINQYIGSRVQAIRKAKGLSQKALLHQLKNPLSQQQFSRYENGLSPLPAHLVFEIGRILGVTTETFMPLDEMPKRRALIDNTTLANAMQAAVKCFSKHSHLDAKELKQLEKLLFNLYRK